MIYRLDFVTLYIIQLFIPNKNKILCILDQWDMWNSNVITYHREPHYTREVSYFHFISVTYQTRGSELFSFHLNSIMSNKMKEMKFDLFHFNSS